MGKVEGGIGWNIKYVISCIKFSRKKFKNYFKKIYPVELGRKEEDQK